MKRNSFFCFFLCFFLFISSFFVFGVSAQVVNYRVGLSVVKPFYFAGNYAEIEVSCNVSGASFPLVVTNASGNVIFSSVVYPNVTVSVPVSYGYGTYTVTCNGSTTWFWCQSHANLQPLTLPYSWKWENVNYTLLANYTLSASAFNGKINVDWVSNILQFFNNPVVTYSQSAIRIHATGSAQRSIDLWLYNQNVGVTFRVNGTLQRAINNNWNIEAFNGKWGLDSVRSGDSLVYEWGSLRVQGVSFTLFKNESRISVAIPAVFDLYDYIFSDGFESGNLTGYSNPNGGASVETNNPHHGTYNLKIVNGGYIFRDLASSISTGYIRSYVKLSALPVNNGDWLQVMGFQQAGDGSGQCFAAMVKNSGTVYWSIRGRNAGTYAIWNSTTTPSNNTWYCIELECVVHASAGFYALWVNGVLVLNQTGLDTDNQGNLAAMVYQCSDTVPTAYIDCVVVDSSYIGPETTAFLVEPSVGTGESLSLVRNWGAVCLPSLVSGFEWLLVIPATVVALVLEDVFGVACVALVFGLFGVLLFFVRRHD